MTRSERFVIKEMLDEVMKAKETRSEEAIAKATSLLEANGPSRSKNFQPHRKRIGNLEKDAKTQLILDEMKQAMVLCTTKGKLLQWAQTNVFPIIGLDETVGQDRTVTARQLHIAQQLIPLLMRSFRQDFHDPHLALFIFNAVRHNSLPSYVYGCSPMAYHELIVLLWESFRDLSGVRDVLREMLRNHFEASTLTLTLVEQISREAMDGQLWLDRTEEGDHVVMSTLSEISDLLIELHAAKSNVAGKLGRMKRDIIQDYDDPDSMLNFEAPSSF